MEKAVIHAAVFVLSLLTAQPGVGLAQEASPFQQAEQAAREALAHGAAEKARNDAVVTQQRLEQERDRLEQERRVRDWEEYERRKNDG
ncbi:hypothetical protein [Rhizobium laguerreae]|uniref:hypothetical protein n=1 Tax=Rhizobium laguerreae TaxID=1076926 RepID=UPI001442079A|nr:hypothetical protein [Rhizobium laguerreae]NKM69405.1 hypothetical protein [Rhizobium laguerreae]